MTQPIGAGLYRGNAGAGPPGSAVSSPKDIAGLAFWLRADLGVTLSGGMTTPVTSGTAPPAVTFSGTPSATTHFIEVTIDSAGSNPRGTATFSWKLNNVTQATGVLTAASVVLGATGISAVFPIGAYTLGDDYETVPAVSEWDDQSGNGWKLVQATAADQPGFVAPSVSGLNGRATINFDGVAMKLLESTATFAQGEPYTVFVVLASANTSGTQIPLSDGNVANYNYLVQESSGTIWQWVFNALDYYELVPGLSAAAPSVWSATKNGAHSTVPAGSLQNMDFSSGAGWSDGLSLGSIDGTSDFWSGQIAELIFYSRALSTAESGSLNQYFGTRYGMP